MDRYNLTDFNTIDLDGYTFKNAQKIVAKINALECCRKVTFKPSLHKGYHVLIFCKKSDCDLCRFVFDDTKRYEHDIERPKRTQNVLFEEYCYHGGKKRYL